MSRRLRNQNHRPASGVIYETVGMTEENGVTVFHCLRSLIEIKTPWKLRNRAVGEDFYPITRQLNNRVTPIPGSYYDQISETGVCKKKCGKRLYAKHVYDGSRSMLFCRFDSHRIPCEDGALSTTTHRLILEPVDDAYCTQRLFPSLERFCPVSCLSQMTDTDVGWMSCCPPLTSEIASVPKTPARGTCHDRST